MKKDLIKNTREEISQVEEELHQIASRLDIERQESDLEDNSNNELLDKKQYLEEKLYKLQSSLDILIRSDVSVTKKSELAIGSEVTIDFNGTKKNITLVAPAQANPQEGFISSDSPIGQALLGKKEGDKTNITTPVGKTELKVISIN